MTRGSLSATETDFKERFSVFQWQFAFCVMSQLPPDAGSGMQRSWLQMRRDDGKEVSRRE